MDRVSTTRVAIRPPDRLSFDWAQAVLSAMFVGGLFLDGWAHTHGHVDQSFFTPWHAVFYAGYTVIALVLGVTLVRNHARGHAWPRAVPAGYGLSLLGALVFGVGGVGDLIWHTIFGIEVGVEALLSPTHLALAVGLGLISSGPVRAAWRRRDSATGWVAQGPMVLGLTATFSVFTFFTEYAHPLVFVAAGANRPHGGGEAIGVASILLQAILLSATILLALRSGPLPPGGLTLLVATNAVAMGFLSFSGDYPLALVVGAGVAGLLVEGVRGLLRPAPARPVAWGLFASAAPAAYDLCYFLALLMTEGISWSVHLWTGSIVMAGLAGWLLGHLVVTGARAPARGLTTPVPAGST
ncbi:MAG TPA: hypothetical protein VJX92_14405 [Methylomirabilota bacterium]|nr:hypothetical protein [Methylomirabilota bacterium]